MNPGTHFGRNLGLFSKLRPFLIVCLAVLSIPVAAYLYNQEQVVSADTSAKRAPGIDFTSGAPYTLGNQVIGPITVSLGGGLVYNTPFKVPIRVDDLSGHGIRSFELQVSYDPVRLTPADVAVETHGTLSEGITVNANTLNPGHIIVSGVSTTDLSGSGNLIYLRFQHIGSPGLGSTLVFEDYTDPQMNFHAGFRFNDGTPAVTTINGGVVSFWPIQGTSTPTATPTVTPSTTPSPTPTALPTPCDLSFDSVNPPALPGNWSFWSPFHPNYANYNWGEWKTSNIGPDTPPNAVFAPDPWLNETMRLTSPSYFVPTTGGGVISFRNSYDTEYSFDGMVLEISVNGGGFQDILDAGGSFVTGGYNSVIGTGYNSTIEGRNAWSGNSGGYITTTVQLPPSAIGQFIRLAWTMATDNSVSGNGVWIDTLTGLECSSGSTPTPTSTPTPSPTSTPGDNVTVSFGTSPAGLSYMVDFQIYDSARSFTWLRGTSHLIAAISPQSKSGDVRYVWENWSDGGDQKHVIQAFGDTYIVQYKKQYLLTMDAAVGTVTPETGFFDAGETVAIFAEGAPPGFSVNWKGSGNGSYTGGNNPANVVMHGPIIETAVWASATPTATPSPTATPAPISVTIQTDPSGRSFTVDGTSYSSAQTFSWIEGSIHTISTILIDNGDLTRYIFDTWSDGGTLTHDIAASALMPSYTAVFRTQHMLSVCCNSGPFRVIPESGFRDAGETVGISAGGGNFEMTGWSGTGNGSYTGPGPSGSVIMNGPITEFGGFGDLPNPKILYDYDGDRRTDISVFRPADTTWYVQESSGAISIRQFGLNSDRLAPADYDGDGKTDIAVYRPSEGNWYIANSSDGTIDAVHWGLPEDIPTPIDFYPHDGRAEIAVFRPSTGVWYMRFQSIQFGQLNDVPIVGDFDGDKRIDIAVYRPSTGVWYLRSSSGGNFSAEQFGAPGDVPVPARWDQSGITKLAVYRPSDGTWYVRSSSVSFSAYQFGLSGDIPVAGYYDDDGVADFAVFRPSDGYWYIANSSSGTFTIFPWGLAGDIPTQSAFGN